MRTDEMCGSNWWIKYVNKVLFYWIDSIRYIDILDGVFHFYLCLIFVSRLVFYCRLDFRTICQIDTQMCLEIPIFIFFPYIHYASARFFFFNCAYCFGRLVCVIVCVFSVKCVWRCFRGEHLFIRSYAYCGQIWGFFLVF